LSLGGSIPYTSTDRTNKNINIHKRDNTKIQYKQHKTEYNLNARYQHYKTLLPTLQNTVTTIQKHSKTIKTQYKQHKTEYNLKTQYQHYKTLLPTLQNTVTTIQITVKTIKNTVQTTQNGVQPKHTVPTLQNTVTNTTKHSNNNTKTQ
jgi:prefoldin subunit 5